MPPKRWIGWSIRSIGAAIAFGSAVACPYAIGKLYTGRDGETPIRSVIEEQPLLLFLGLCAVAFGIAVACSGSNVLAWARWLNPAWVWRNRRRELALLVAVLCLCTVALEVASRAAYARQRHFPFLYPVEHLVYPPLYEQFHGYDDGETRVLFLGGSVLYFAGMSFPIEEAFDGPARVYNVAQTAHSSLDSLVKFRYLLDEGYRFDYVVFYHGINEVRANNVPPGRFSIDYDHYFFYRLVNTVFGDRNPLLRQLLKSSLFFRTYSLVMQLGETRLFGRHFVHIAFPREDWLVYGGEIQSQEAFERNLKEIIALCESSNAELIVPRYAYHPILDDWAGGKDTGVDEDGMIRFTEQWGLPGNVLKGLRVHNEVLDGLADQFHYLDTSAFDAYSDFVDPCHFDPDAQTRFQRLLAGALREAAK